MYVSSSQHSDPRVHDFRCGQASHAKASREIRNLNFRKQIISAQNKFNRNEVVLMMLSNNVFKNSTPSIFSFPYSKMTKTPNFVASYLRSHSHDHLLVFNIASHSCDSFTYSKQSMSASSHRVHSGHD